MVRDRHSLIACLPNLSQADKAAGAFVRLPAAVLSGTVIALQRMLPTSPPAA
jgi:hypothetical protein